jgi:membrane-bound lytic murein transglycosylase B
MLAGTALLCTIGQSAGASTQTADPPMPAVHPQSAPAVAAKPNSKKKEAKKAKPAAKSSTKPDAKPRRAKAAGTPKPPVPLVGSGPAYAERGEAMQFADELAQRRQLPPEWTRQVLGQARLSPSVVSLMQPATSPFVKNWRIYRSRFLDELRINAGLKFWQEHRAELARAEARYGVPIEIIVGVLGVETIYGRDMGRFRVMDALSTLAFDFPAAHPRAAERSQYFRKELEQFMVSHSQNRTDPFSTLGSYAGATGLPQFMPSSIASFAVDFDGDGRIDLRSSTSDAIGSVAHYLQAFGWKTGMPTHYPVRLKADADMSTLLAPDILPTFSAATFQEKGAVLEGAAQTHTGPLALIELLNGTDAPSFVAGTENFYVITRYNWSSYYAMAVIDLGQEIASRFKARP